MYYFDVLGEFWRGLEEPRSYKIYSLGKRGVKKGPGPRGSRDEEFLVPSLHSWFLEPWNRVNWKPKFLAYWTVLFLRVKFDWIFEHWKRRRKITVGYFSIRTLRTCVLDIGSWQFFEIRKTRTCPHSNNNTQFWKHRLFHNISVNFQIDL